mgnify:CR=1 FL=1
MQPAFSDEPWISMTAPGELPALLEDPRVSPAPYLARGGWVVLDLTSTVDWTEVTELVHTSYCLIAPKSLAANANPPRT